MDDVSLEAKPPSGARRAHLFQLEGEYWTIAYEGSVLRLRDAKGLRYLARLLQQPGESVAAKSLVAPAKDALLEPQEQGACEERARLAVTKRLKATIAKITLHHSALGHHLGTCVKTGLHCVYRVDPARPVTWTVRP